MRLPLALVAVAALGACKYPEPPDQCDGYCTLFAIDKPLARPGDTITLEGNLDKAMRVTFPGDTGEPPALTSYGPHRATVVVPANATAGLVGARGNSNYTEPVAFRATSFALELQPFLDTYEQTDGARVLGGSPGFTRVDSSVAVVGDTVYMLGGTSSSGLESSIELAIAGADGSLTAPMRAGVMLTQGRARHASMVVGRYMYAIGGRVVGGPTDTVDGANLDSELALQPFGVLPIKLTTPREGLATVIIGNYVYAIGGRNNDGDVDYLERAPIADDGLLGDFEAVSTIKLRVPRSGHTVAVVGNSLYVIGGFANGIPIADTERFEIFPDAYLGDEPTAAGTLVTARGDHRSIVIGDSIYVIGGTGDADVLTTVEKATLGETLSWQALATHELHTERTSGLLVQAGNHVFVVGGKDAAGIPIDTFERASIIGHSAASPNNVVLEDFATTDIELNNPRADASTFVLGHTLYVIGGETPTGPTGSVEMATIAPDGTLSAFTAAPIALNQARMAHASFVYDNFYYVAGGQISSLGFTNSVERAPINPDGTLGTFQPFSFTLDTPRGYFGAVVVGRQLFVAGGLTTNRTYLNSVFKTPLTPTLAAMTQDSTLPGHRAYISMFALPANSFMFGGRDTDTTYAVGLQATVDPKTDDLSAWFGTSANPSDRRSMTLVSLGDTLYAVGGVGDGSPLPGTERLTLEPNNQLTSFGASPVGALVAPRYGHASVTLGDHVHVLGGRDNNTQPLLRSTEISTIR